MAASITRCRDAGIRVVMITGDSAATATAIAKDVNIFAAEENADDAEKLVFEGAQFFSLPEVGVASRQWNGSHAL